MAKITVVGSFVTDIVARMEKYPEAGETVLGQSVGYYPGGKGANQCVAVARLGGDTEMCGMLGSDSNGEGFREILRAEGIKSDHVFSCEFPTAVAQIQIDAWGQNRICVIPSANYRFGFEELDKLDETVKKTKLLLLQLELRLDVTRELIRRAYGYGVKILLNPAPAVRLEAEILRMIEYLTPNEKELSLLTGEETESEEGVERAAKLLREKGVSCVVTTAGAKGAYIYDANGGRWIRGFKVKAVDTVAAGDSFNGALAVALTEGKNIDEAAAFANAVGALTVQKQGAIPSLPYRAEVEKFLRENS